MSDLRRPTPHLRRQTSEKVSKIPTDFWILPQNWVGSIQKYPIFLSSRVEGVSNSTGWGVEPILSDRKLFRHLFRQGGLLNSTGGCRKTKNSTGAFDKYAMSIESKGISNQSNRTLAEICANKKNAKKANATSRRIKPNVLGFVRTGIRFEQILGPSA